MRDRVRYKLIEISDRLDLTRETWCRIGIAVVISVTIVAVILATTMPRKGILNDALADFQSQIDAVSEQSQNAIDKSDDTTHNLTDTLNSQMNELNLYKAQLADTLARLNAVENALATAHQPIEDYVSGVFPEYTLYATSSDSGNFTANVHLIYQPFSGNSTNWTSAIERFYAGVNYTLALYNFVPVISFGGAAWGVSQVWFNIGTVELIAHTKKAIEVTCVGLNQTPSFAYVEVYKI